MSEFEFGITGRGQGHARHVAFEQAVWLGAGVLGRRLAQGGTLTLTLSLTLS
jgi:hypothetical protein